MPLGELLRFQISYFLAKLYINNYYIVSFSVVSFCSHKYTRYGDDCSFVNFLEAQPLLTTISLEITSQKQSARHQICWQVQELMMVCTYR